jgi:hypothetical protein
MALTWQPIGGITLDLGDRFNDLAVANNRLWAASSNGMIVQFSIGDGNAKKTFVAGHARCIGFEPRGAVGWLGMLTDGSGSRLKKSTDGGDTWDDVASLPADCSFGLCGLAVLDAQTAFACGTYNQTVVPGFWRTIDGTTWTGLDLPRDIASLIDLQFWDANRGIVVGGTANGPAVLLTQDAGASWSRASISGGPPQGSYCWKISFVDSDVGFVSVADTGASPFILTTIDGGQHWAAEQLNISDFNGSWDLQGIGFVSARQGWVGQGEPPPGTVSAFGTVDGTDWTPERVLSNLNRVRNTPQGTFACGASVYRLVSTGPKRGKSRSNHRRGSPIPSPDKSKKRSSRRSDAPKR